jgi:glycerol-3-phosphate acyltransferase PlsX
MATDITVSLDAMGGDEGAELVIPGAAEALVRRPDLRFRIYGEQSVVEPVLARYPTVAAASIFEHCDYTVAMDDKPSQALRHGRYESSSMWRAIEAVKTGEADFAVSAGNTGALMAMAKFCLKTMPGHRPPGDRLPCGRRSAARASCSTVGATIGADAQQLWSTFAVMGACHGARPLRHRSADRRSPQHRGRGDQGARGGPRGGRQLREEADLPNLAYRGFVEGDDIGKGTVDVVVTEGFAGNIALKTAEGTAKQIGGYLRSAMNRPFLMSGSAIFLARDAFRALREKMDPRKRQWRRVPRAQRHRHQEPRRHRPRGLRHGDRTRLRAWPGTDWLRRPSTAT